VQPLSYAAVFARRRRRLGALLVSLLPTLAHERFIKATFTLGKTSFGAILNLAFLTATPDGARCSTRTTCRQR
jgi:hypothetical protein